MMKEEDKKPELPEGLTFEDITSNINQNLSNIRGTTDEFFKKKLIMFCVRWGITLLLLYLFLGKFPWIKYIMYVAIPLGLLNLIMIFVGRKKLNDKLTEMEDKINSL